MRTTPLSPYLLAISRATTTFPYRKRVLEVASYSMFKEAKWDVANKFALGVPPAERSWVTIFPSVSFSSKRPHTYRIFSHISNHPQGSLMPSHQVMPPLHYPCGTGDADNSSASSIEIDPQRYARFGGYLSTAWLWLLTLMPFLGGFGAEFLRVILHCVSIGITFFLVPIFVSKFADGF